MTQVSEKYEGNNANTLLCKVYIFMIDTDKRIIQIVSKNEQLTDVEKTAIQNEYGKINAVYDAVGRKDAILLNFA